MFDFHKDKDRYFEMQYLTARDHIIPFLENHISIRKETRVLEVGCAEAGVLKAFLEKGCQCMGIELSEKRTQKAIAYHEKEVQSGQISFLNKNIYDIDIQSDIGEKFDLIILKDVIEHIPQQDKLIERLTDFLLSNGQIFFGFPPWQMPFGGHQQICRSKWLGKLPYFHLLPKPIYKSILKSASEPEAVVKELIEIKETGITIERFERIISHSKLGVKAKKHFLFNPIYQYKFNVKTRTQLPVLKSIPILRNFYTTAVYYLVGL